MSKLDGCKEISVRDNEENTVSSRDYASIKLNLDLESAWYRGYLTQDHVVDSRSELLT